MGAMGVLIKNFTFEFPGFVFSNCLSPSISSIPMEKMYKENLIQCIISNELQRHTYCQIYIFANKYLA